MKEDQMKTAQLKDPDSSRYEAANQRLTQLPVKYKFEPDGASFSIHLNEANRNRTIQRMDHASNIEIVASDKAFNRGVKRGNTILSTGDMPRFALLNHLLEEKLDPDMIKLGDGRIRISCGEVDQWLDEADEIGTIFHPSSTNYRISYHQLPGLEFNLIVSQAEDWGVIAKLSIWNRSNTALPVRVMFTYGGIASCPRTVSAAYFSPSMADTTGNRIELSDDLCQISHEAFPQEVWARSLPKQKAVISDSKAQYSFELGINPDQLESISLIAGHSLSKEAFLRLVEEKTPEQIIAESKDYYERILACSEIRTPSAVLDSGFKTAVLNHEYAYSEPAWLEGVHWWAAYWNNNYQISAAISLGQIARARNALEFFGIREEGPGCLGSPTGKPVITEIHKREEWLPYYLYALIHYYEETGDQALLEQIWISMCSSIEYMWEARDKNQNTLLNWHLACNPFLYQADHLGMPGDAASPSLMMMGMLERMSTVAAKIGKAAEANGWEKLAAEMSTKLIELLWNKQAGVFYNHIDLQGIKHMAHYYTDHVFPTLYTSLAQEYGWQSLQFLYETLWLDDSFGKRALMRVGSLKPAMFGNDNVMPVQMSEAAQAYFAIGDAEKGAYLLESVALASTVFTEAPGNFPERMGDDGKGEANYIFGNPIGAFLHSTISGLFGLSVVEEGETLQWTPAFPQDWDEADIKLTYVTAQFKGVSENDKRRETYTLSTETAKKLSFRIYLVPGQMLLFSHNGSSSEYTAQAGLGKTILDAAFPSTTRHEITIEYIPIEIQIQGIKSSAVNSAAVWGFSAEIEEVKDLQGCLKTLEWKGTQLHGIAGDNLGKHSLFVKLKEIQAFYALHFEIVPPYTVIFNRGFYDEEREALFVETQITWPESSSSKEKSILHLNILDQTGFEIVPISERGEIALKVGVPIKELPPEGVAYLNYTLVKENGEVIITGNAAIAISGESEATKRKMQMRRDQYMVQLDISELCNAHLIRAASGWRHSGAMHRFKTNALTGGTGIMQTPAGDFKLSNHENCLILVEYGYSDTYTRETLSSDLTNTIQIPIAQQGRMLSILYANEVESRHTGEEVGRIRLCYEDGETVLVPLIVGQNLDTMFKHFAKSTIPVKLFGDGFQGDYANVLQLACNSAKVLKFLELQVDVPDVHIGVLGINVC